MTRKYLLGVVVGLSFWSSSAEAAQFVVFDALWTHTANIRDSHYYPALRSAVPENWVAPVNYSNGTAHVHLEVLTKPSQTLTRFQVCFEGTPTYACTAQSEPYATTGVLDWGTAFSAFWSPPMTTMNWTNGIEKVAVILKDTENNKPSADNVGDAEAALYMPTRVRMVVTIVSQGSTYVPPGPYDAGAPISDAGVDARADARADASPDASTGSPRDGAAEPNDSGAPPDPSRDASADAGEPADAGTQRPPARANRDGDDDEGCSLGGASPSGSTLLGALALLAAACLRRVRSSRAR